MLLKSFILDRNRLIYTNTNALPFSQMITIKKKTSKFYMNLNCI
jgi:hypothetical protein